MNVEVNIKMRKCNCLHYLVSENENSMLFNFFSTQWKYPALKNEWTEQVKQDLTDFGLSTDLNQVKSKSKSGYKNQVRIKAKGFAFLSFLEKKQGHTKLDNLFYRELKLQD